MTVVSEAPNGTPRSELSLLAPDMPEWMDALGNFPNVAYRFNEDRNSVTIFGHRRIPNTNLDEVIGATDVPLDSLGQAQQWLDSAFNNLQITRTRTDPVRVALERADDYVKGISTARAVLKQASLIRRNK